MMYYLKTRGGKPMSQKKVYLALIWHMHQPFYKDPETGIYELPWVRLHCIKDYLDMALMLKRHPGIRLNFTMTPSLLEQIVDYANGTAIDKALSLSLARPSDMSEEDRLYVLDLFFSANFSTMIKPYPRYLELYEKRGGEVKDRAKLCEKIPLFSDQEILDLQVWFNLSWTDPLLREEYPELKRLIEKGKNFSEDDKLELIEIQKDIIRRIIPTWAELQDEGRMEIATVPYSHPILPLLCDISSARETLPEVRLPNRDISYISDARAHIEMAIQRYSSAFGRKPKGMWPSEGAISNRVLPLLEELGIEWIASDEDLLSISTGTRIRAEDGRLCRPDILYRPYISGNKLSMIFRDKILSDLIGFVYSSWDPDSASSDFLRRLLSIPSLPGAPENAIVSVILDGENCWQFYKNDGFDFLDLLYKKLEEDELIETVTVSEYLEEFPPKGDGLSVKAGSWIGGNLGIWVGHSEDNKAWEFLADARTSLLMAQEEGRIGDDLAREAWRSIYIAEGSDWFWWYGDDHSSPEDEHFDRLYRKHIMRVYKLIGEDIPPDLLIPIKSLARIKAFEEPVSFLKPVIDGIRTHYYEWEGAGRWRVSPGMGATHRSEPVVREIRYGFDEENLFLGIWTVIPAKSLREHEMMLVLELIEPSKLRIELYQGSESLTILGGRCASVKITEVCIPFSGIGASAGDKIIIQVVLESGGREMERWPKDAGIAIEVPSPDYEMRMWMA
jgi:alpha-amylase/alpha-mannosidase (GH57 family)